MIKELPTNTNMEIIKLISKNLSFRLLKKFNLESKLRKEHLLTFMVELNRSQNVEEIFKLMLMFWSFNYCRLHRHMENDVYSIRCNRFDHAIANCHRHPRCLKGGKNHREEKTKISKSKCIVCSNLGHVTSCWRCPGFLKPQICAQRKLRKKPDTFQKIESPELSK
ncbi:hypothetical protein CEXT_727561 [Caerostris extrusa]|uniref:Uncharacterized protein n=1 Tax=Caerostris extrusa TaxID=172846 RepID=A0AAV4PKP1_CAEEX|nr:hypothetical protein CEXT_727561 [Caerostris extrusa]